MKCKLNVLSKLYIAFIGYRKGSWRIRNGFFKFIFQGFLFFVSLSISRERSLPRFGVDEIRDESITGIYIQTRLKIPRGKIARLSFVSLSPSFSSSPRFKRTGGSHDAKVAEVSRVYRFKNGVKGSRLDANKVEHLTREGLAARSIYRLSGARE